MYLSDYIRPDCATKLCYTSYGCRWGCWWWFVFGGGVGMLWREFGLRKNLISFATQYCIKNQHGITKWHNFVTRWYCPVMSRKMLTLAKIINLSKWIFFIVKVQIIMYIFSIFMPITFLDILLEDNIQLSVHHTVPESDQSISFEDFTP